MERWTELLTPQAALPILGDVELAPSGSSQEEESCASPTSMLGHPTLGPHFNMEKQIIESPRKILT